MILHLFQPRQNYQFHGDNLNIGVGRDIGIGRLYSSLIRAIESKLAQGLACDLTRKSMRYHIKERRKFL